MSLCTVEKCVLFDSSEYRLFRDFNFIIIYKVSQHFLLRCTRTDTFVNNRNKFSNLSALVTQTFQVCAGILLGSVTIMSKNTMTLLKMLLIIVQFTEIVQNKTCINDMWQFHEVDIHCSFKGNKSLSLPKEHSIAIQD